MATCDDCQQEMERAEGCTTSRLVIGTRTVVRRRWRPEREAETDRCGDCGAGPGGWHHLGCDVEPCPLCRGPLLSCTCGSGEAVERVTRVHAAPG